MKKVLLTTSALAFAMAGAAYADVSVGGSARVGITFNENAAQEWDIEKRTTFNIDGTTTTDGGLTIGARIRLRSDENDAAGTNANEFSGSRVTLSNDVFKLSVGNAADVMENLPGMYANSVGLTGLGYYDVVAGTNQGFSSEGVGNDVVRLDLSFGGADFSLSYQDFDNSISDDDQVGASIAYNFGDWTVAVGHEDVDGAGFTAATVGGSFGNFDVDLAYADNDGTNKWTVGAGTSLDSGLGLRAYVTDTGVDGEDTVFGLGFTYSLGGATLAGGLVSKPDGDLRADFGVRTKF